MRTTGPGLRSVFGPLNSVTRYWGPSPAPTGDNVRVSGPPEQMKLLGSPLGPCGARQHGK